MIWQQWPLVGRDEELRVLKELVGGGRSVVLAGEAGVGKTRLHREFIRGLGSGSDFVVRSAVATSTTSSIPLGALAHLIDDDPQDPSDQLELLRVSMRSLVRGAKGRVLLAVDDAHFLDDLSATLVHQLAITGLACVVLTVRRAEQVSDAITSLWRDDYAERIEIQPLSEEETSRLVSFAVEGTISSRALTRFWEISRGNPLFLRELVLGSLEAGTLRAGDGVWTWNSVAQTDRLHELVAERLGGLQPDERRGLQLLAFGEPLETDRFTTLVEPRVFAALERRGLAVEHDGEDPPVVRLVHPLYAEGLRASTKSNEARELYRVLYESLAASGVSDRAGMKRLALFHLESGGGRVDVLLDGFSASLKQDDALARRFAEKAFEDFPSVATAWRYALTLQKCGRLNDAMSVLEKFDHNDAAERRDRWGHISTTAWVLRDSSRPEEALALVDGAIDPDDDSRWGDLIVWLKADLLLHLMRYDELADFAEGFISDERRHYNVRGRMLGDIAQMLASGGRTTDALELIDRHMPTLPADFYHDIPMLRVVLTAQLLAMALDGNVAGAIDFANGLYAWANGAGHDQSRQGAAVALAAFHLGCGRPETALRYARESNALARQASPIDSFLVGFEAEALAVLGRCDEAMLAWEHRPPFRSPVHSDSDRQLAWVKAACGDIAGARKAATRASDAALAVGALSNGLLALYDALRLGAVERAPDVVALAERCQGAYVAAVGRHAAGITADDPVTLAQASVELEAAGRILCAAEAAAQAAAAFERNGLRGRAATQAGRSRTLAARCEGAKTPILAVGPKNDPLTRREREVAQLAASGLSNKEIAERLVASVRTVEGHLYQAYAKLGVSGRDGLVDALSSQ